MQVPETDVTWTYSLLTASENKATARTGTPAANAAELVGVDGSNNGGIQPFPGFREIHRFAPESVNSTYGGISFTGSNPYTSLAHRSRVVDFWSFSVIAGASTRVFGYVYLVRRPNDMTTPTCNNDYDLIMEFYAPNGTTTPQFRTILLQENIQPGEASLLADQGKAVMSVETTGKAVYIFRRGVPPIAVYFKVASTSSTPATLVSPAGPGVIPKSTLFSGTFGTSSTHNLAPAAPLTTPFPNPTTGGNPLGSVVFARTTTNPNQPAGATISNFATAPVQLAGTYSLAVQFEDTRSGRKSQLTTNIELTFTGGSNAFLIDGIYNNDYYDTLNVYRSVRTGNAAGAYTGGILQLEAQITLSSYVTTTLPVSGGTLPSGSNIKYFRYAYQLTDSALVMQDVFLDKPSYSTEMPKGGAGALLDGTMLVGNISDSPSDLTGTGETRWSYGGADSPELFTASGIYKPSNVGDAVTCFRRTGQIMTGLTRNGVQLFSKDNGYVRVLAAHQGYGVTGPYAATTVGPVTYFMNYRGLKAIYPDGRLDDVQSINQLVSEQWYSGTTGAQELSKVSMAFDPATLCMYVLNPTRQQSVQMWFSTGVVSELQDMSFAKVTQGWWEDADGQLVPRALFLFNAPLPDVVTNTAFRPAVYMPCRTYGDKSYPEAGTTPIVTMLDCEATHSSNLDSIVTSSYTFYDTTCTLQTRTNKARTCSFGTKNPFTNSAAVAVRMIGASVYVAGGSSKSNFGAKSVILDANGNQIVLGAVQPATNTDAPVVDSTIVLDPVFVRWVGAPMRLAESKDEEFVVKQPTSIGAVFTDVSVTVGKEGQFRYWYAGIYRENESAPILEDVPLDTSGNLIEKSIQRGDTPNWVAFGKHGILGQWFSPFVETWIPNLKYRLVGVQVKGRILPTDRTRRTY
jgi:hypothetical protein